MQKRVVDSDRLSPEPTVLVDIIIDGFACVPAGKDKTVYVDGV